MPTINWDTVVTAGATALVVTAVVEFLARPWLEVRKERILERIRARRALVDAIVSLTTSSQMVLAELPKGGEPDLVERFRTEQRRQFERMENDVRALYEGAGKYAGAYPSDIRNLIIEYVFCLFGIIISARTQYRKAMIVNGFGPDMAMVLDRPHRWQVREAMRSMWRVRELIKATQEAEPSPASDSPDVRMTATLTATDPVEPHMTREPTTG